MLEYYLPSFQQMKTQKVIIFYLAILFIFIHFSLIKYRFNLFWLQSFHSTILFPLITNGNCLLPLSLILPEEEKNGSYLRGWRDDSQSSRFVALSHYLKVVYIDLIFCQQFFFFSTKWNDRPSVRNRAIHPHHIFFEFFFLHC